MVQGDGSHGTGQGRRRNRRRAKGRGGGQHEVLPVNGVDRSRSESSSSDLGTVEVGSSTAGLMSSRQQTSWFKSLKMDMCNYDLAKLRDAEKKYYSKLALTKKTQEAEEEDDVDLFSSDDEEPKAAPVKPTPKPVVAKPTPKVAPKPAAKVAEKIWTNKAECDDAEKKFEEALAQGGSAPEGLSAQIAKARQHIKNSLECVDGLVAIAGGDDMNLNNKLQALEVENKQLKKVTDDLKSLVIKLEARVAKLEIGGSSSSPAPAPETQAPAPAKPAPAPAKEEEEDDDVDLFGSDDDEEEDAEKARITAERLKAYHEKKAKKPALIAKTNVLFDVKPWGDDTDMNEMLKACKSIEREGLVWGASKLVPIGYGINKLQIMCVVEDEKVSIDELSERMTEFEDFVQSVDVAAMSKI